MADRIVFENDPTGMTYTGFGLAENDADVENFQVAAAELGNVRVSRVPDDEAARWWVAQNHAWNGGAPGYLAERPLAGRDPMDTFNAAERQAREDVRRTLTAGGAVMYLVASGDRNTRASLSPFRQQLAAVRSERAAQTRSAASARGIRYWPGIRLLFGN